jgi:hypothetical protein
MDRLLRPFTGTGSVFFPIGPPPYGTCEYATTGCLEACYVNDRSDFDEETRIPECAKREMYHLMITESISDIVDRLLLDLAGLQTHILSWFGSGDCLEADVDRISSIIDAIPKHIVQMGFTRNQNLWELHKGIFALTIEKKEDAPDPIAMYAIPNYDKETSVMFSPHYTVRGGYCGPIVCQDQDRGHPELTHYINCKTCHRLSTGCFDRRG